MSLGRTQATEPLADLDEQPVAGGVAEAVVDLLEAVQVQEQHRDRGGVAFGAEEGVVDPVLEQGPVGQGGEVVVEGLVDELVLELAAFGDVAGVEHQPADAGVVEQVGDGELGRAVMASVMPDWQLQLEHAVGPLGDVGERLDQPRLGLGVEDAGERLGQQLLIAVAEDPGHGLADVLHVGVSVDQDHDLRAVLDQGLEALLAGSQLGGAFDHP